MTQIDLDEINLDDLAQLRTELNDFFNAHDTYQWAYCEGEGEYIAIALRAEDKFDAVRRRIKNLAIDLGIHHYQLSFAQSDYGGFGRNGTFHKWIVNADIVSESARGALCFGA